MSVPDLLVVGGGAIGCSIAYHAALAGLKVTLLERDRVASGASGAAAGMLAPISESHGDGPLLRAGLASLSEFPALVDSLLELTGIDAELERGGLLQVSLSDAETAVLRSRTEVCGDCALEWLSADEVAELEPHLGRELQGAARSSLEAHVYSPKLVAALAAGAKSLGATIEEGVEVLGLRLDRGRFSALQTRAGERAAGCVVIASGAWAVRSAKWLREPIPVRPVKGQILSLLPRSGTLGHIVWGAGGYLVPKRAGSVVVGATVEEVGFDRRVTSRGVTDLLRTALRLMPALADAQFKHAWAGLRPGTPDCLPIIGPASSVAGVFIATGHYRNGVLLSPWTGRVVAELVVDRTEMNSVERELLNAFSPGRFGAGGN
jgi:glycine oxidase